MNLVDYRKNHLGSIENCKWHIKDNLKIKNTGKYAYNNCFNVTTKSEWIGKKRELIEFADLYKNLKNDGSRDAGQELCDFLNNTKWIRELKSWRDELVCYFDGCYFECNDCGSLDKSSYSYNVNDDYEVCDSCKDSYYWNDDQGYYQEDYWEEEEERSGYDNIGCYHSSKNSLGHIPSSFDDRKPRVLLGLELEMECNEDFDKDERAGYLLDHIGRYKGSRYGLCEEDGSLDEGFELVTSYTGLDVHKEHLQFFKHRFEGMASHNTSTCGLHIHICKSSMTTLHGAKMVFFINDTNNYRLIKALARRDNSFAKIKDKKADTTWLKDAVRHQKLKHYQLKGLNQDRYEALNFNNEKTIEFRLFKGSLKYETIMACLEFTYATWHFCKDASIDQLTTDQFIKFICKPENKADTRFLRIYLKNKGFNMVCGMPTICPDHFKKVA